MGCLNGFPLENIKATMIELIVPKNHMVVFSKLVKTPLLPVFSGAVGEMVNFEMLSFFTVQALKRRPKKLTM
jgi:hypothetical protein